MTVVQFPPRTTRPNVISLNTGMTLDKPDSHSGAIARSQFEVAHELADELERLPPMSDAVAMFIKAAKDRLTEVAGDIETQLQAMSARQLADMTKAMMVICEAPAVDIEDDFIGDLMAFEARRRELGIDPDGAA